MILGSSCVIVLSSLVLVGSALAAENSSLVNRPVRVEVAGLTAGAVPGKLIAVEGCLYVQFDQTTKDGISSVRLDQVTNLQLLGAGASPSLRAMLSQEPRKCFVEGAG